MATATAFTPDVSTTTTWRSYQAAVLLSLGLVGAGGLLYLVETRVIRADRRFIENPSDVMVRAFGLAHFWVGWLFLFTSPRLRTSRAAGKLGALILLGASLCLLSWTSGGTKNPIVLILYYAYFLYHEIRDEAGLFEAYGDAPAEPGRSSFLVRLGATATLGLITLFALVFLWRGRIQEKLEHLLAEPEPWIVAMIGILLGASTVSAWSTWRTVRREAIDLHRYTPLFAVYGTIASILVLGSLFGSIGFNMIVLIHGMAWLVFVRQRLANGPAPTGWWDWLRRTPAGLIALHAFVTVVVLALMALRVHVWERSGWYSQIFATSSFHYWTVMHITMAFWRK